MIGSSSVRYLANHGLPSDEEHISKFVMSLSLVVGIVQLILAILTFGTIIKKYVLRKPFVSAFTTASAYIIATSQLGPFFALKVPQFKILGFFQSAIFISTNYEDIHLTTLYVAATSSILIVVLSFLETQYKKKLKRELDEERVALDFESRKLQSSLKHFLYHATYPVILAVIAIYIALSHALHLSEQYAVKTVGTIPRGLPNFTVPEVNSENIKTLIPDSLPIALVSYIITVSLAETFASSSDVVRANQELFATSLTCIIGSFFLSYSGAGSLSRTAVVSGSGAKTQVSSVVSAIVVIFILLWVAPVLKELPVSVLASIIIVSLGSHMKRIFTDPQKLWKQGQKLDCGLWIVSFTAVIIWDAAIGCIVGLVASLLVELFERSQPHLDSSESASLLNKANVSAPYKVVIFRYSTWFSKYKAVSSFVKCTHRLQRVEVAHVSSPTVDELAPLTLATRITQVFVFDLRLSIFHFRILH
jgi:MFS superfamily sulfate permease-like transporter